MNKIDQQIQKHRKKLQKQELRILNKKSSPTVTAFTGRIQRIIPEGLKPKLELAFYQGFRLVFSKGTAVIEKTYDKDKLKRIHETDDFTFENNLKKRALKQIDRSISADGLKTLGFTAAEGTVLGLLGIGLPDIPIFIGVLLKGIYETALKYGYSYEDDQEKFYILQLIEAALAREDRAQLNQRTDLTGSKIDCGTLPPVRLEHQMRQTANTMAVDMLSIKFIQGMPLIGVIGGASNAIYFNKIMKYARIKYKKRYLNRKTEDRPPHPS